MQFVLIQESYFNLFLRGTQHIIERVEILSIIIGKGELIFELLMQRLFIPAAAAVDQSTLHSIPLTASKLA